MSPFNQDSVGALLERVEVLRSSLRLRNSLDRLGVQKIQRQVAQFRNDLLLLSRQDRYEKQQQGDGAKQSYQERRQALLDRDFTFEGIFGDNPKLLTVLETLEKAARTDLPVVVEGESGTGKELLAKVVHANSERAAKPYVSVNCGAIPEALLESELFGHVKGAFTGAVSHRNGKFEQADGGTLFLDEIGELSLESQVKLLRVLQSGDIQRVGSDEPIRVDTRIVAATNRDLYQMTLVGEFREDLYYRLSVISVRVPPLREREDEIPLLIDYFRNEAAARLALAPIQLSPPLRQFLQTYSYRGNIRELQNIIYRISSLATGVAGLQDLPDIIRPVTGEGSVGKSRAPQSIDEARNLAKDAAEEQFLRLHLTEYQGKVTLMAKYLEMNRSYLQTLMKKHGMKAGDFKNT